MKSITVHLDDEQVMGRLKARAERAGVPLDEFIEREVKRVIVDARDHGRLPVITQKYAGFGSSMTDGEFREFRRGYLTRKYE